MTSVKKRVIKTALNQYTQKRNFKITTEPAPRNQQKVSKKENTTLPRFVVQKHDATHLHYDFRLEIGGVLVSWAVPKGPPLKPGIKRLAIQTEDHPLEYGSFEGIIPEGQYGAGTVELWDQGVFYPQELRHNNIEKTLKQDLSRGVLEIYLEGNKLKGPYALVKTKLQRTNTQRPEWLLFKQSKITKTSS